MLKDKKLKDMSEKFFKDEAAEKDKELLDKKLDKIVDMKKVESVS